jgi:lycopene cyclase domain-containing protein
MTYFGVLGIFIVPPVVALTALVARIRRAANWPPYVAVMTLAVIAVAYTAPWDNYLVATSVWWYDEALVTGVTIGWVPIEEYSFFALQTLLTGLWTVLLMSVVKPVAPGPSRGTLRLAATILAAVLWLLAVGLRFSGWSPVTYLSLILAWALIPMMGQLAYGADVLYSNRRLLLAAIAVPTVYLWSVDFLAIRSGTWTLDPAQTLGLALGGILAIEEMAFFFVTNVLISFGMVLMLSGTSQERAKSVLAWAKATLRTGPMVTD